MAQKNLDLICLGRAGVDFYAQQVGSRLEDVASFAKYIGGSSTNIACCSSRMGLRTALITRVGDEHMGEFIREQLQREGVDTQGVVTDPDRLTALVVLGIKDQDTFPLIFYRENCADMAISADDIDGEFIASSKALLITGTHLSTEHILNTSKKALQLARASSVKTVLDIDYRPVLWGLTSKGDGETRFIASDSVTSHLQSVLPEFDLVVGTEEEVHIAGGSTDTLQALKNIRGVTDAVLVLKRGPYGASVYDGDIPDDLDKGVTVKGVTVEVMNVLGAGDAFISGFLRGWLNGEGYEQALRYANACGALVVSRHGCTPAMPTKPELDYYLEHSDQISRPDEDTELTYLHRVTTWPRNFQQLYVHAFDHRKQLQELAQDCGADLQRIGELKEILFKATSNVIENRNLAGCGGILCDDRFGQNVLNDATGSNLWVGRPVEVPGSRPIQFEGEASIGSRLAVWPTEQVVKCLVFYSAGDSEPLRQQQDDRITELYQSCCVSGHQLLLEIIPPAGEAINTGESLYQSVQHFFNIGVRPDWWKIPCISADWATKTCELIEHETPYCCGVVVLGLDAPAAELARGFEAFKGLRLVKGFAVGRTIFSAPAKSWLAGECDDAELIARVEKNYSDVIDLWRRATSTM